MDWMPEGPDYPMESEEDDPFSCTYCRDIGLRLVGATIEGCFACRKLTNHQAQDAVEALLQCIAQAVAHKDSIEHFVISGRKLVIYDGGPE